MDDSLIDEDLPLARKSRLPGTGFFYPDSLDEGRAEEQAREVMDGAEAVVVADTDADGLGCVTLIREARDATIDAATVEAELAARLADEEGETAERQDSSVGLVGTSPHRLQETLEWVGTHVERGTDVFVCDLCPDSVDDVTPLETVTDRSNTVRWFDHHQWDEAVAESVRATGVDLVVGDEECAADVTLRELDHEFPSHLQELTAVTRDHDLWRKQDSRSDDLADYAHWSDPEAYVAIVGEHGPDLPAVVEKFLDERREQKAALIDRAVGRAHNHEVGPWTVATTYGRCSQNEVGERLRAEGADAVVVVKPAGSVSIRGSDDCERCHEVAGLLGGGGHPQAAGCKPDIYDDMLDYARHWTTEGEAAKRVALAAFERVAERPDD